MAAPAAPRSFDLPSRPGARFFSSLWPPLLLYLLALALRLPEYTAIPPITDETKELLWSLAIYRREHWPLTAADAYIGPLASYLTAASYALFGPSLAAGRAAAIALGALIAPATWALARAVDQARQGGTDADAGDPPPTSADDDRAADGWTGARAARGQVAGIVAGTLAAVAFGPVVISHVAWSHGGAPAWLALALAGLAAAHAARTTPRRTFAALLGGVCGGLALGAHPTVVAFAPGVAAGWWLLARRFSGRQADDGRAGVRVTPRLQVLGWTMAGLIAGYSPGLLVLAGQGLAPFRASAADQDYVGLQAADWPLGIAAWLDGVLRNLIGPPATGLDDPRLWLGALVVAGAIAWAWRRGQRFLAAVLLSGALVMPLIVDADKFLSLSGLRFSAPALPALAAALALAAVDALAPALPWLAGRPPADNASGEKVRGWSIRRLAPSVVLLGLLAGAVFAPMAIFRFYTETERIGVTSRPILALVDAIVRGAGPRDGLLIDAAFDVKLASGGNAGEAIGALLEIEGVAHERAKVDKIRWFLANGKGATYDLVLAGDTAEALSTEFALEPVQMVEISAEQESRSGDRWGWYRFASR